MRGGYKTVLSVVLGVMTLLAAAGAQSTQPAISNEPVPDQNASTQSQLSSQGLSPEAQAKLVKGVGHALLMLPYYGVYDNLAFRLQGRTVILEGQVLRSSLKPDAERAVKKVEGVDAVVNKIQVLPPGGLDDRLRREVYHAIYDYPALSKYANMPIPPIRIIVRGGNVTLEGVVDTETDKGLCSMRVKLLEGALNVTNNLRVVKG